MKAQDCAVVSAAPEGEWGLAHLPTPRELPGKINVPSAAGQQMQQGQGSACLVLLSQEFCAFQWQKFHRLVSAEGRGTVWARQWQLVQGWDRGCSHVTACVLAPMGSCFGALTLGKFFFQSFSPWAPLFA